MPDVYRQTKDEYHLPKGVSNRNKGLHWILKHAIDDAVVYFADDDNTYDLRLFSEVPSCGICHQYQFSGFL